MTEAKQISLTDQLGAMAVIDGLRQRSNQVQEVLNAKQNEALVADRLREYYTKNGIEVTDDLIEQGVEQYYSKRYVFTAKPLTAWQRMVSNAWMDRARHQHNARNVVGALAIGFAAVSFGGNYIEHQAHEGRVDTLKAEALSTSKDMVDVRNLILAQTNKLNALGLANSSEPFLLSVDKTVRDAHVSALSMLGDAFPGKSTKDAGYLVSESENIRDYQKDFDVEHADNKALDDRIAQYRSVHSRVEAAMDILKKNGNYLQSSERYILVKQKMDDVLAVVAGMKLDAEDRGTFNNLAESAQYKLHKISIKDANIGAEIGAADTATGTIDQMVAFAKTPITLTIVNRSSVKSGVERTYDESKGKSWYAIVEPLDEANEVSPMLVKSNESGREEMANLFGIAVTHDFFKAMKADKRDDGHIDNNLIGKKPVNSLKFKYEDAVVHPVKMILEW